MKDINVKNKTLRIKHGRKFLLPWVKQQVYSLDTKNHNPLKKKLKTWAYLKIKTFVLQRPFKKMK